MSCETVEVKSVDATGVWVEGIQASACGSCSARAGCGHASLKKLGRPVRLWVETRDSYSVGEHVLLELPDGSLAASATALYGIPLVTLVAGAALGQSFGDLQAMLLGGLGLACGFGIARWLGQRYREQWQPHIVRSCNPTEVESSV